MNKLVMAILVLFVVVALGFGVYVLVTYGGKPITEIPSYRAVDSDNAYAYKADDAYEPTVLQDFFCPNCGARMEEQK